MMFVLHLVSSVLCLAISAHADLRGSTIQAVRPNSEQCGWPSNVALKAHDHRACALPMDENSHSWSPWTYRPYCAGTQYCVFTNSMFRGNNGVSIITTSEIAASSPDLVAKLTSARAGADPAEPPYTVRDIPGKGKGLFATRRIARGDVFMEDYPSVLADVEFPGKVRRDQGQLILQRAIEQLGQSEEVLSLARSSTTGAPVQEDVMRTNTFGITIAQRSRMALFPRISRMNHACNPNAFTRFAESTLVNRVIAFRDIEPEEEITISCIPSISLQPKRLSTISPYFVLTCACRPRGRPPLLRTPAGAAEPLGIPVHLRALLRPQGRHRGIRQTEGEDQGGAAGSSRTCPETRLPQCHQAQRGACRVDWQGEHGASPRRAL
ncbi:hypothetical protein GE09DRAFT_149545 [Coniochaeta sp. 2T2.1]|nr:hypothetical protein GE09DRAFT_149545 [Coniochaeta sp. 2T2.1]